MGKFFPCLLCERDSVMVRGGDRVKIEGEVSNALPRGRFSVEFVFSFVFFFSYFGRDNLTEKNFKLRSRAPILVRFQFFIFLTPLLHDFLVQKMWSEFARRKARKEKLRSLQRLVPQLLINIHKKFEVSHGQEYSSCLRSLTCTLVFLSLSL